MKRLFCVMGKSASGKDTIYKKLLERMPELGTATLYTTRPMRDGETDGVEYFFTTETRLRELKAEGRIIESRTYETVCGPWTYATVDDGQFDRIEGGCLMIGTLESYGKLREYFGPERVVPLYVEVEDGLRFERAMERERQQRKPNFSEVRRRYQADQEDFCEEKLSSHGIVTRYENENLEDCLNRMMADIRRSL